jgi:membrane protein
MRTVKRLARSADDYQRRHVWLALPIAVGQKYADDQAWILSAVIAYYAFLAIFPLLLVLVTVLDVLLRHDPDLRHQLVNSALSHYPVIGSQLQSAIGPLNQTGLALAAGLVITFVGARGVANAMQNAINSVWGIPMRRRPKFPQSWLRSFALLIVLGVGLIATTILSGVAGAGNVLSGVGSALAAVTVSLVLNIGMYWVGFQLASAPEIGWRQLFPGAVLSAIGWQALQSVGGYLVTHQLARSSNLYGTFAIVLGLVSWLFLEAQLTVLAIQANVVLVRHLWPRSIDLYAEKRGESQLIRTNFASSSAELASAGCRPSRA